MTISLTYALAISQFMGKYDHKIREQKTDANAATMIAQRHPISGPPTLASRRKLASIARLEARNLCQNGTKIACACSVFIQAYYVAIGHPGSDGSPSMTQAVANAGVGWWQPVGTE